MLPLEHETFSTDPVQAKWTLFTEAVSPNLA